MEAIILQPSQLLPARQEVNQNDLISILVQLYQERKRIYNYHPLAITRLEAEALDTIRYWLSKARISKDIIEQTKCCLLTEKSFHVIADNRTAKFRNEYWYTLNLVMNACREIFPLRKQA